MDLLNNYFEAMIGSVYKYNGTLDKYIGDAMMTVFGVPYANKSDAKNAVSCALDMLNVLSLLNKNNNDAKNLNIGIGISTGNVVSGNIGAKSRYEYTVIGNPVNLAARLESETKKYNIGLLICENTFIEIKNEFHCREIDTVIVKGINKPVRIFTVTEPVSKKLSRRQVLFNLEYSQGLAQFKQNNYKSAQKSFRNACSLNWNDGPTLFFLEKCKGKKITESF